MPKPAVFDIECINWAEPLAVGFFDGENYFEFLKKDEGSDPVWAFLNFLGNHYEDLELYAHNAADFDNKFVFNCLTSHNQRVSFAGGMTKMIWLDKGLAFLDSYALLVTSLAAACRAFGVAPKLAWNHDSTTKDSVGLQEFRDYLRQDCLSLSECLDAYASELADKFNISPASTISLTAVKAFNKGYYNVRSISSNENFENIIRLATYGSRNEVYRRYGEKVYLYDIRFTHVSCYDVPVPIGKLRWATPNIDQGTVAEAFVKVPDRQIGPLPYRYNGALIFPTGEFTSWWDMTELRSAVEEGCDLTIRRQLSCDEAPILKTFGEYVVNLRREAENADMARLWKLLGVRLCGKFGQHRERQEIRHISDLGDLVGFHPIDKNEIYYAGTVYQSGSKSPYTKPAVNMRIRSAARVKHLKYLLQCDPYYGDTDSVYTTTEMTTGENAGDLRSTGFAEKMYIVARKFYGYTTSNGVLKQRTAGFRDAKLSEADFKQLLNGNTLTHQYKTLTDWRTLMTKNELQLIDKSRETRSPETENRIISGLETYPIKLPIRS